MKLAREITGLAQVMFSALFIWWLVSRSDKVEAVWRWMWN